MRHSGLFVGFLIASLLIAVMGCGGIEPTKPSARAEESFDSRVHQLNGKVTYKGSPLTKGVIRLDSNGKTQESHIEANGMFKIVGITLGFYKVSIEAPEIPAKYCKPETSELSVEVKRGVTTHHFELKD